MFILFGAVNMALFVVIAYALMYKYRQTRQLGFLWLAIPLVLLPFTGLMIANGIRTAVDALAAGQITGTFPFSLVESGQLTLGTLLSMLNVAEHLVWSSFTIAGIFMLKLQRTA